jgi:hypothetical protein
LVRRSTATSWRSTSSSTSFDGGCATQQQEQPEQVLEDQVQQAQ